MRTSRKLVEERTQLSRMFATVLWRHFTVVLFVFAGLALPAAAQARPLQQTALISESRFIGQVSTVGTGNLGNPVRFTLVLHSGRVADFRVAGQARITALSAEASVEGFVPNDYAVVYARRVRRTWTTDRVLYDVQPIALPKEATVTGVIERLNGNAKRVQMRLDAGGLRWFQVLQRTKFHIDGQLVPGPPSLSKGDVVRVSMQQLAQGWVALDVNLISTAPADV